MKKINESVKTNSTRPGGKQPQKQGSANPALVEAIFQGGDGVHTAILQATALLEILSEMLFDELQKRKAPSREMEIVNGLGCLADSTATALNTAYEGLSADITTLWRQAKN